MKKTVLAFFLLVGCSSCNKSTPNIILVHPANGSQQNLTVTFIWMIENKTENDEYFSDVILDKGSNPFDGAYEDLFSAGCNTQLTVNLDPLRYAPASVEWGVKVTCHDQVLYSSVWKFTTNQ